MRETIAFSGQMLDAGYLMLDIQQCTGNAIQKHPGSRIQDPGSVNIRNDFHRNDQVRIPFFMQLSS